MKEKKKAVLLILAFAMALFGASVSAAEEGEEVIILEPEIVTGSRIYTSLEEIPAPTYVIDREEIEKNNAKKLSDILSSIPGIYVTSRSGRTQEDNIKMRGFVTEVLILVDGVPYYNATHAAGAAAYDLRSIPVADIERIEVVKGAGSALYGSMAAAGVINIITRKPEGEGFSILGEAGADDWRHGTASAWTTSGDFGVRVRYSKSEEGEVPLSLTTTSGLVEKSLDYDDESAGLTLQKGPFTFNASWGEYDSRWTSYGFNKQEDSYSRFNLKWEEGPNRLIVYYHNQEKSNRYESNESLYDNEAWGSEFSRKTTWGDVLVSWGAIFRKEDIFYDTDILLYKSRKNYAPFIELSKPVGDLILNLGLRYEMWDQDEADDYDELMPKFSLLYQTLGGTTWYLSAGRVFAMPSVYELFGDRFEDPSFPYIVEPNFDLKPEKGYSYEIGAKGHDNLGVWNAGFFYTVMDDKIIDSYLGFEEGYNILQYENVDKYRAWGIEASKSWALSHLWNLRLGATWMSAEEKESGLWKRARAPEWDVDTSLLYRNGPLEGELTVNYFGNREEGEGAESNVATVDASIAYQLSPFKLRLSVYNLFDEDYWQSEAYNTYYYGPERRVYLTLERVF
ncbi:MAG TPA: TonB-dependent receptor [Synergistaceae bacterium]|nr:TonB-dependent receptor [Synergistaceae bacterium]